MEDIAQKIKDIEEEIRKTPYHKGTEHHIGRLKAKIAKLKEEQLFRRLKNSGGGGGKGFSSKKTGDATVVLVGPPSVGKSTLINKLTSASSKVAEYEFTTINVIPGMMDYQGAKIQILDIPGIISGAAQGKGRGKEVLSVVRIADLIIIMVDINSLGKIPLVKQELYNFGIRLDEEKPKVSVVKNLTGGLKISSFGRQSLSSDTIKEIVEEFKIRNGEVIIKEPITTERLIDALMGNRVYLPYLVVVNKIDVASQNSFKDDFVCISAKKNIGLEELKKEIWEKLGLQRIYLKPIKGEADFSQPLVVKKGKTLKQILPSLSLPGKQNLVSAKIFGPGAKFPGQRVSLEFQPQEGTIVSLLDN